MRLDQAKDRSIQECLETSSKYCILVQFEARSRERIAILSGTVTCNRPPQHTARRLHWESGMDEDGGGAVPQSTLSPKIATGVVLKPNSHSGQQEQREQDARTSCDQPSGSKSSGEIWNNAVDYRIPGILLSTVEQQDTNRKDRPKRWLCSSRATRTRNPSFWTWNRRVRSTSSARNRRSSQPTWTTLRSSKFSRLLPNSNAPIAISASRLWKMFKIVAKN